MKKLFVLFDSRYTTIEVCGQEKDGVKMLAMECSTTAKEQMVVSRLKLFYGTCVACRGAVVAWRLDAMAQVLVLFAKVRVGL